MLEETIYTELQYWWDKHNLEFPSFNICETDIKVAEWGDSHPILMAFDGLYHPIQYFCGLKKIGIDTPTAKQLCKIYEDNFYKQAKEILKHQYNQ
jgi:hypothetical protein